MLGEEGFGSRGQVPYSSRGEDATEFLTVGGPIDLGVGQSWSLSGFSTVTPVGSDWLPVNSQSS